MRIALDVSILNRAEPTGVEKSFRYLIQALSKLATAHEFFLVSPVATPSIGGLSSHFVPAPVGLKTRLWRQRSLPAFVKKNRIDIIHSPVSAFPLLADCKKISTLHEIPWLESGTAGDEGNGIRHRAWAYLASSYADRILCVSHRTAENLESLFPNAKAKTRVSHHGVDLAWAKSPSHDKVLSRFQLSRSQYFLCVSRTRKKKNLLSCLEAFKRHARTSATENKIAFVGPRGNQHQALLDRAQKLGIENDLVLTGYVSEEELAELYRNAIALLSVAHSEGFGLPLLEAMACGIPVIASKSGAIPEIAGPAAIYSSDDPLELAEKMTQIAQDSGIRQSLSQKGIERAALFSWDEAARRVLALYEELGG